ncbi:penicillin-binding protein activator LpoB [Bordetella ansorpii]|nr:penicillin-binding protein activator LpoB [Bordetella ansorpii]
MDKKDMHRFLHRMAAALAFGLALAPSARGAEPRIAVTDLAYEERVSEYFRVVSASDKRSVQASASEREGPRTFSSRERLNAQAESRYFETEGAYSYIEHGELRKYTADLKGAILKGGGVRLVQARAHPGKPDEKLFDVISRIRRGQFAGADYVLFGTVNDIQFNESSMAFGTAAARALGLDLSVAFSLIDTRTYEVKAAFSALGSGQDVKVVSGAGGASFSRPKVIAEASRSLAEAAYGELMAQFGVPGRRLTHAPVHDGKQGARESRDEAVVRY